MKTLLVIGYVWPEPKSSAAGSRMLQLLRAFQQQEYRIVYASPADRSDHAVDLVSLDIQAESIALNCSSFDDFISALNPKAVMFDRFMMEEQFGWRVEKYCPDALRILDSEDLHFLRHARHAALKANAENIIQPDAEYLYSDMAKREVAAILRCDLTLTISEFEMELLQRCFNIPANILHYCPFMCVHHQVKFELPTYEERQHFVSIGNFRHEPNWDAVRYLKERIWPVIRQQLPSAELHIYGAYPPKKATQLHNEKQGFLVKGWAHDALQVVAEARVMLAPLRFGAGLKGKLIDAALCHTPAVTTSIGSEGMYGNSEKTCGESTSLIKAAAVADTDTLFAAEAVRLYNNEPDWRHASKAASKVIATRFDYARHSQALMEKMGLVAVNIQQHRLDNFYGAMLRHHSLKSSQYMSQWIEAKNKLL
ncbi:glycosyltransferase family 4 protein [Bacterioplanoides sp. SCSIO 12839]|nr:glycosyltransferase family 4 protein [Bacterioplanoides sp. SCSIO 12839]